MGTPQGPATPTRPATASAASRGSAAAGWALAFGGLFLLSRHNHPNATINALATLAFVGFAAGASAINRRRLAPLYRFDRRIGRYIGALLGLLLLTTFLTVLTIRCVYLLLWHDDPLMFGFWTNMALDFIVIGVLVGAASATSWCARRLRGTGS